MKQPTATPIIAAAACALAIVQIPARSFAAATDHLQYDYALADTGVTSPGRLVIPAGYNPAESKTYPLIVFYPGSGEDYDGTNRDTQFNGSITNLVAKANTRGYFAYVTQFSASSAEIQASMRMVARILKEYKVDPSRIYTTGLSLGGTSSSVAISDYREIIAGAAPLSGGTGSAVAARMVNKPLWLYHARNDFAGGAEVTLSRQRVNSIRSAQGKSTVPSWPINTAGHPFYNNGSPFYTDGSTFLSFPDSPLLRYTEYASGGHSSATWNRAYGEDALYDWLFSQQCIARPPHVGETMLFDLGAVRMGQTDHATADSLGRYWNATTYTLEKTTGSAAVPFALTSAGRHTTVILDVVAKFDTWLDNRGVTSGAPYDSAIARDLWITKKFATASTNYGAMEFRGLQPGAAYQVKIYASDNQDDVQSGVTYVRSSRYEIAGQTRDLTVDDNNSNFAMFASTPADGNGKLLLKVYANPTTNSRYGEIGVVEITPLSTLAASDLAGAGLTGTNVGSGSAGSSGVYTGGDWKLSGSGSGLASGATDSFRFENANITGDFRMMLNVKTLSNSGAAPRAGLMLRSDTTAGSPLVSIASTASSILAGYRQGVRTTASGTCTETTPADLMYSYPNATLLLERTGKTVRVAVSSDGTTYREAGFQTLSGLPAAVAAGAFVSSGTTGTTADSVMSDYELLPLKTPISEWKLNETSGTTAANNAVGSSNAGTLRGGAAWSGGVFRGGASFTGASTDWMDSPSIAAYSGSQVSVSFWFNAAAVDAQPRGLVSKRVAANNQTAFTLFTFTGGRLHVDIGKTPSGGTVERFDTGFLPVAGTWYHVAMVFDGTASGTDRLKVYIDGALQYQAATLSTAVLNTTGLLHVGSLNANYATSFNGQIDEVRIYNQALTPADVELLQGY